MTPYQNPVAKPLIICKMVGVSFDLYVEFRCNALEHVFGFSVVMDNETLRNRSFLPTVIRKFEWRVELFE